MRVFVFLFTSMLAVCMSSSVFAKIVVEVNQHGASRTAISTDHWEMAGISVTDEAQKYIDRAQEAFKNPREIVPVETHEVSIGMVSPFGLKKDLVADVSVVYDQNMGGIDMISDPIVLSSSIVFSPFLIWWTMAIFAIGWLNLRRSRAVVTAFDIFILMIAIFGVSATLITAVSASTAHLFMALFFVFILLFVVVFWRQDDEKKRIEYWIASVAMYSILAVLLLSTYSV